MKRYLTKARAGDRDAEEQLFRILRARLMAIAKRRVWGEEDAEDVAQEACVTVMQKYKSTDFHSGFEAWACTVLRMKIGNYLQSKKVRENDSGLVSSTERLSQSAAAEPNRGLELMLIKCLRKIGSVHPRYARVLSLSYQGYKADEICRRLQLTRTNLYSLLSRSRSLLSKCLETGKV